MSDAWIVVFIYLGCYLFGVLIALAITMYAERRRLRQPKRAAPIYSFAPFSQPVTHGGLH